MKEVRDFLTENGEEKYGDFNSKLIPTVSRDRIMGVRTPLLRKFAKEFAKNERGCERFKGELPHVFLEENLLHAFLIEGEKSAEKQLAQIENFLPYIDNWAVCDCFSPKAYLKDKKEALKHIDRWLKSEYIYARRFAVVTLKRHYLDDDFDIGILERAASQDAGEYYISMVVAWFFAEALIKQYADTIPYMEKRVLDEATHMRTIQKAVDSYRISDERKVYLKSLRKR